MNRNDGWNWNWSFQRNKSWISWILCLIMTFGFPLGLGLGNTPGFSVQAATTVEAEYVDAEGNPSTVSAISIDSSFTSLSAINGNPTWYIANNSVTISTRVAITGDIHLILGNGSTLTVNGGLEVTGNNSLTIYGQSIGTGILNADATGADGSAGIGGTSGSGIADAGRITINGGTIDSIGGIDAAGIGGGLGGNGGTITINNGLISAKGSGDGAGIGGGEDGSGGSITINGGTVTADGANGYEGAGIGGGDSGSGGTIIINGGTITATGGTEGAGIGSGDGTGTNPAPIDGGTIKINGGTVTATGGTSGAGIGGGNGAAPGSFSTSGNPLIYTSGGTVPISDTSKENTWKGIIFQSTMGAVYGTKVFLSENLTVDSGNTLTIPENATLDASAVTISNDGTIINNGLLILSESNSDISITGSGIIKQGDTYKTADGTLVYLVNVTGGTANGKTPNYYKENDTVTISANIPTGKKFKNWQVNSGTVTLASITSSTTTFTMPGESVAITALFDSIPKSGGGSKTDNHKINLSNEIENGTIQLSHTKAVKGTKITLSLIPAEDYQIETVTVTDQKGNNLTLTDMGNGKFTFIMPERNVTVGASFSPVTKPDEPWNNPFTDVYETDWYYNAIAYVSQNGIMSGVAPTRFAPNDDTTRSMIAAILYRLEGEPDWGSGKSGTFVDVPEYQWYTEAIEWAASKEIISGYGDGTFGPDDPVTREQLTAILYRFAQQKGMDTSTKSVQASLHQSFIDAQSISEYAIPSMQWAVCNGLISGFDDGTLQPQGKATRAQIATILMKFLEN